MANIKVLDAGGFTVHLISTGAGSDADPFVPGHYITSALPAGANNIGDVDVLTLVGDDADLDSGVGVDDHAVVAWGLPASGGHVVGGTGANPIRIDPVASTVQPVGVVSWFTGAGVVASVIGNPAVLASIAGVPNMVASVIGNPAVIASLAGVGKVEASVIGNPAVIATISGIADVSIRSQFIQLLNTASVIGNPQVIATVAGVAKVEASTIGTIFAVVNTGAIGVQDVSIRSQYIQLTNTASVIGNPAVIATVIGVAKVEASTIGTIFAVVNTGAIGVQDTSIRSQYIQLTTTASTIGTIFAVVNTGAVGVQDSSIRSQYIQLTTTASVIGNPSVLASIPDIVGIAIRSQFIQLTTTGSVIGNPAVLASIAGVPNVVASVIGNPAVLASISGVANVVASQIGNAVVTASVIGNPAVIASIPYQSPIFNTYTLANIQVNGSGVVAGNVLASHAAQIVLVGYQLISAGTVFLSFYDGTINAPLTGSLSLWPSSGIAVPPYKIPLAMTTSGRGLTIGLSASCNIGGGIQYFVKTA